MSQTQTIAERIANLLQARVNCVKHDHPEWYVRHTDRLEWLVRETMPSGGGFDYGTTLDLDRSTPDRLVFQTSFHHMDEMGGYDGWTQHTITARPSFVHRVALTISGRDRNQIKDMIADSFSHTLGLVAPDYPEGL